MKKSSLSYFLAVLVVMMLSFGGAAIRAQQTEQTDQSDTATKSKSKTKTKSAPVPPSTPAAATSPAPSPAPTAPASEPAPAPKRATQRQTPAAHSAGTVWVNTDSGVYHKPGSRWYGKTKQGKYMTEADAQKAGYRAASKE